MKNWIDQLSDKSFFYITPDVKRGIGLESLLPNFHIICTYQDPIIPILRNQGANIFCLADYVSSDISIFGNSGKLIEHPQVASYIESYSKDTANILVFKPSEKMELICRNKDHKLLVNSSRINSLFEDKVGFYKMLLDGKSNSLIPGMTGILGEMNFEELSNQFRLPFVVQFAHGWAGKTTFFIKDKLGLERLVKKYPFTRVKINKYIKGYTVLNNACIYNDDILISPPAIQISNIDILGEKEAVTCGRQWPARFMDKNQVETIRDITYKTGKLMQKAGFRGYFGLDFMIEEDSNRVYLSENNARFTASSAFFTKLELGLDEIPLLVYHIAEFLNIDLFRESTKQQEISGSQIIFRNPDKQPNFNSSLNFGVYNSNELYKEVRKEYKPDLLTDNEFIFMRRKEDKTKSEDLELSRIETREEVLESTNKFKTWIELLLK